MSPFIIFMAGLSRILLAENPYHIVITETLINYRLIKPGYADITAASIY